MKTVARICEVGTLASVFKFTVSRRFVVSGVGVVPVRMVRLVSKFPSGWLAAAALFSETVYRSAGIPSLSALQLLTLGCISYPKPKEPKALLANAILKPPQAPSPKIALSRQS